MKFTEIMLGNLTPTVFLAFWLWSFIGLVLNLGLDILQRKPQSVNSPRNFDWNYWWADNKQRIIVSFILLPFAVIFGKFITGTEMNIYLAFCVGFGSDYISNILKRKGIIKGCNI